MPGMLVFHNVILSLPLILCIKPFEDCLCTANLKLQQALTVRQIYRISTMYWDDKYGTQSVSNEASCYFGSFLMAEVEMFYNFLKVVVCRWWLK